MHLLMHLLLIKFFLWSELGWLSIQFLIKTVILLVYEVMWRQVWWVIGGTSTWMVRMETGGLHQVLAVHSLLLVSSKIIM
jgi:hypothetical protein